MFLARVQVMLKPGVLDPQGAAVQDALRALNYTAVENVRVGKYLEISLAAASADEAKRQVEEMCDRLLANPVIEEYSLEIVAAPGAE